MFAGNGNGNRPIRQSSRKIAAGRWNPTFVVNKTPGVNQLLRSVKKRFAVVVANLTAETIIELAGAMQERVAPKGFLILSGIMHHKAKAVVRRFSGKFQIVKSKVSREWVTLLLRRK